MNLQCESKYIKNDWTFKGYQPMFSPYIYIYIAPVSFRGLFLALSATLTKFILPTFLCHYNNIRSCISPFMPFLPPTFLNVLTVWIFCIASLSFLFFHFNTHSIYVCCIQDCLTPQWLLSYFCTSTTIAIKSQILDGSAYSSKSSHIGSTYSS